MVAVRRSCGAQGLDPRLVQASLITRREQRLLEKFITKALAEVLDKDILHDLGRRNLTPCDPQFFVPPNIKLLPNHVQISL